MLQFQALGLTDDDVPAGCVETNEETGRLGILGSLYLHLGNQLATQYVGSEAHDKTGAGQSASSAGMRAVNKAVVSARRYISNSFKDQEKQQAIDVFLGIYNPRNVALPIWLSDDRSFVWSSQKYYEYCPSRPNRLHDGWWQRPLQCFLNGFQVSTPKPKRMQTRALCHAPAVRGSVCDRAYPCAALACDITSNGTLQLQHRQGHQTRCVSQ